MTTKTKIHKHIFDKIYKKPYNMATPSSLIKVFNDQFEAFLSDIQLVFPENPDICTGKNALQLIKKANPKMIVKVWYYFIVQKFKNEIEAGNIDFFLQYDYSSDVNALANANQILESINRLRAPISMMTTHNRQMCIKYMQTLTKLSCLIADGGAIA